MAGPTAVLQQLSAQQSAGKVPECTGTGWLLDGGAYLDGLPNNMVTRTGDELERATYSPDWQIGDGVDQMAYAIYRFNLNGYMGLQTIGFTWTDHSFAWRDFFVGFGDLAADSWDWYKGPADDVLTLNSFGPYRNASGEMLMIVAMLGSTPSTLIGMEAGVPELRGTGAEEPAYGNLGYPLLGGSGLPTTIDLSGNCAPVNDQLTWGSCTAFAVGDSAFNYELHSLYQTQGWDLTQARYRVSPKHLYVVSGQLQDFPAGGEYGRWTELVVSGLTDHGVATELNAPYDLVYDNNGSSAADADAAVLEIDKWAEVPCNSPEGISTVKAILAYQRKVLPMQRAASDVGAHTAKP
jgi:hypothetical protein